MDSSEGTGGDSSQWITEIRMWRDYSACLLDGLEIAPTGRVI